MSNMKIFIDVKIIDVDFDVDYANINNQSNIGKYVEVDIKFAVDYQVYAKFKIHIEFVVYNDININVVVSLHLILYRHSM